MMWRGGLIFIVLFCAVSCDQTDLKCTYLDERFNFNNIYYDFKTCFVKGEFTVNSRSSVSLRTWASGYSSYSINYFHAYQKTIKFIPENLGEIFENLIFFSAEFSGLSEIRQNDLKQFPKLKIFYLHDNNIEHLESNLFMYNPNLTWIRLWHSKIKYIDPHAFNGLPNLNYLDLDNNLCIHSQATGKNAVQNLISTAVGKCKKQDVIKQAETKVMTCYG